MLPAGELCQALKRQRQLILQASATPAFNVDTFGENLMSSNRSLFQAASHSDHSSPDSARRLSDAAAPFGTAPAEPQLQQQGPPHSRSGSLPPLPERSGSAEAGGMAAFAGYSALAEGNGGLSAPLSSFGAAPPISGSSTVCNCNKLNKYHVTYRALLPGSDALRFRRFLLASALPPMVQWAGPFSLGSFGAQLSDSSQALCACVQVADSHQHTVSPALHGTPQPLSSTPE